MPCNLRGLSWFGVVLHDAPEVTSDSRFIATMRDEFG